MTMGYSREESQRAALLFDLQRAPPPCPTGTVPLKGVRGDGLGVELGPRKRSVPLMLKPSGPLECDEWMVADFFLRVAIDIIKSVVIIFTRCGCVWSKALPKKPLALTATKENLSRNVRAFYSVEWPY